MSCSLCLMIRFTDIDVGCSQLIIDGQIKVKHGCEIAALKPRTVVFTDGTEIEADAVIFRYV